MSVLRILDKFGDTAIKWDVKDKLSVQEVKQKFDEMVASGQLAYRIDSPSKGEVIRKFDPTAKEIIIHAPLVGG
jgi:hypothetical protein